MQSCVKNRKPDTSAAWKAEAEQSKAEVSKLKKDLEELLKELSIAKDALSQQIVAGQTHPCNPQYSTAEPHPVQLTVFSCPRQEQACLLGKQLIT